MNFKAQSEFTPRDISRVMQTLVPKFIAAVTEGCGAVVTEAKDNAPVVSGALQGSIHTDSVSMVGSTVQGVVVADAPHAGFVEFGTGLRGEGTYPYELPQTGVPFTGSWDYDFRGQGWIGHEAQPFMRPALDQARSAIKEAYARQGLRVTS